eukprot:TRINITY_DN30218_c0_g1_i1.p1 TRINITY_DN30218_c0_g1~~TRINITY_DN30218_c0_g1_i1.p1  ORF type:complete len:306 (+),score=69.40 TRINITY_DN30218_c0_g1_i1:80-919(+)
MGPARGARRLLLAAQRRRASLLPSSGQPLVDPDAVQKGLPGRDVSFAWLRQYLPVTYLPRFLAVLSHGHEAEVLRRQGRNYRNTANLRLDLCLSGVKAFEGLDTVEPPGRSQPFPALRTRDASGLSRDLTAEDFRGKATLVILERAEDVTQNLWVDAVPEWCRLWREGAQEGRQAPVLRVVVADAPRQWLVLPFVARDRQSGPDWPDDELYLPTLDGRPVYEALAFRNPSGLFCFAVDYDGRVRWRSMGAPTARERGAIRQVAADLSLHADPVQQVQQD